MPRPKPDPEVAAKRDREQARNRVNNSRTSNLESGGENLAGPIDPKTAEDLKFIVDHQKKTNAKASKIGAVRWAIRKAAELLRTEIKQEGRQK